MCCSFVFDFLLIFLTRNLGRMKKIMKNIGFRDFTTGSGEIDLNTQYITY